MKIALKSLLYASLIILTFSCKDKVIEKPDSLNPIQLTLAELLTDWSKYENQTIMVDSVYFNHPAGTKFNDSGSNTGGNKDLVDCNGNTVNVFTYASDDWALMEVPSKMGKFYAAVSQYNGELQLRMRSYDDVKEMTLDKCAEKVTTATITEILNGDYASGTLVKILDVQFTDPTGTWDFINDFEDCAGNTMITYVASDATFKDLTLPQGNGPLIGVLELYNTEWELKPRSEADGADMIGTRCTTGGGSDYFSEDFGGASLTANNAWNIQEVANPDAINSWVQGTTGGKYAKASNFISPNNHTADWWLISPAINLSTSTAPKLSFDNVTRYSGPAMKVLISTNYDGTSAPSSATWTDITSLFTLDTDDASWTFKPAGTGDITAYKSSTVYIAFQYTGSSSDGATWEVDNILIAE